MTRPPRARVRQSFERAAASYDSAADVQRAICARLATRLPTEAGIGRVLDAGCGTGHALGLLRAGFPAAALFALDLSPAMLHRVGEPALRLAGDLEQLPLADASIDLYWTSLAVQWCDAARALAEAHRVLRPGGRLLLASLGPATFHELRHAFGGIDRHRHTLDFLTPETLGDLAAAAGFATVDTENRREMAHHPDFRALLRAVKAVGANQLGAGRRRSLMSRAAFGRAEANYETLHTPDGLPLTYDVITLSAGK